MSAKKKSASSQSTSAGTATPKKYSPAPPALTAPAPVTPAVTMPKAVEAPAAVEAVAVAEALVVEALVAEAPAAEATVATSIPVVPPVVDVTALVAALQDASADAACDAAIALGTAGNPSAVEPLVAVVANRDGYYHSVVRAAAAASLGQLGDTWAVPTLAGAIRDPMAEASAEAVRALAALGDARAVSPLIDVVRNDDGYFLPFVRRAAVFALAKLGGPEATATLSAVAGDEYEDAVVRQAAIGSVG